MLDLVFCIPIMFGCPTKIKTEGDLTPRVCPMCHNASVQSAKSRTWFELCFVPLIPMKSKRVWICPICNWSMPIQQGWQPQMIGDQQGFMPPAGQFQQHYQAGYQPSYQTGPNNHQKTM